MKLDHSRKPFSGESGQAATEYVLILVAVVLSLILVGYGLRDGLCTTSNTGTAVGQCGNVFSEIGNAFSSTLSIISTILKLPI